ncbi:MAG: transposase, partial [Deltaproteobacteria bacterium]|nr:transposase [Deltaproteobacteria bacterium]
QFSRAVNDLAINLIPAYSPQAKGRVERSFQTFQDRLCKELHRHNIVTMKDANLFLEKFLKDHNKRFSIKPHKNIDFHRAALPAYALKKALCIKTTRSIARDFTVRHNNQLFQLKKSTIAKKAVVEDHTNGSIVIRIKTQTMPYKNITHLLQKKNKHKEVQTVKIDPISLKEIAS